MCVSLVVFDIAGTTVHDGDAVNRCLTMALHAAGIPVSRDEVNSVMGIAKPLAIQRLVRQRIPNEGIQEDVLELIHGDFVARMQRFYREDPEVREIEGASTTFQQLREHGVKIALDTGFSRPIIDILMQRLGWVEFGIIDVVVTSDEVQDGRPQPDMIFRAMHLTGVTDAKLVAKVGDTPSDLKEGANAGCGWVVGVTEGSHTRDELIEHPHTHLIPNITALIPILFPE